MFIYRRFIGISFGISHIFHAFAIFTFYKIDSSEFFLATTKLSFVFGGFGYVFIFLLLLTSFQKTAQFLGPNKWVGLHKFGIYVIWTVFFLSFLKRAVQVSSLYWVPVAILIFLWALRIQSYNRKSKGKNLESRGLVEDRLTF